MAGLLFPVDVRVEGVNAAVITRKQQKLRHTISDVFHGEDFLTPSGSVFLYIFIISSSEVFEVTLAMC